MPQTGPHYYSLPDGIGRGHVRLAAAEIKREGVPPRHRSRSYDVFIGRERFPAKQIIRLAAKHANGKVPRRFHAQQATKLLRELGYKVIHQPATKEHAIATEDDESAFPEGRERFRLHRVLERKPSISLAAKKKRLEKTGRLECDVCGFDFVRFYGDLVGGFIEAHHIVPISLLDGTTKTRVIDLALVCSNCHRMLHRGDLLTVSELHKIVRARAKKSRVSSRVREL